MSHLHDEVSAYDLDCSRPQCVPKSPSKFLFEDCPCKNADNGEAERRTARWGCGSMRGRRGSLPLPQKNKPVWHSCKKSDMFYLLYQSIFLGRLGFAQIAANRPQWLIRFFCFYLVYRNDLVWMTATAPWATNTNAPRLNTS